MHDTIRSMILFLKNTLPGANWLVRFGLSGALLWVVFSRADLNNVFIYAVNLDIGYLMIAASVLLSQIALNACRWLLLLHALGYAPGARSAIDATFIGNLLNLCLPGGLGGEVYRVWRIGKAGVNVKTSVISVLIDRILVLLATLFLSSVVVVEFSRIVDQHFYVILFPTLLMVACCGVGFIAFFDRFILSIVDWPTFVRKVSAITCVSPAIRSIFTSRYIFWILALSLSSPIFLSTAVYFIAASLSIHLEFATSFVIVPPVLLLAALPISLGGWGLREAAMVFIFGFVGIGSVEALTLSLSFGVAAMAVSLVGFVFLLDNRA